MVVLGGSGNVGAYAVQFANRAGARVTAVGSNDDAEYMRSLGADETIDYRSQNLEESVSRADAVIDTVGGEALRQAFAIVKPGGMLVSSVSQPSEDEAKKRNVRVAFFIVDVTRELLERITRLIDEANLKTDVGIVLKLSEARTAHEMLAGTVKHPRGKIVLDTSSI